MAVVDAIFTIDYQHTTASLATLEWYRPILNMLYSLDYGVYSVLVCSTPAKVRYAGSVEQIDAG